MMWEAIEGILKFLPIALLVYVAGLLRMLSREVRDANARAKEDREASEQRDREIRADFTARADRDRAELMAQIKEDRELNVREHAQLSELIAAQSKSLTELSKSIAELFKAVAAVRGNVQVLLDRSDRSSGGKVGTGQPTTRYEFARLGAPTPREEEHGEDGQY